jgi:hypothetical protein
MAKVHEKNGFEYTHEKFNIFGNWIVHWKLKPKSSVHWMSYEVPTTKTKKIDVEIFLDDPINALEHYSDWFKRVSDVELARKNLEQAEKRLDKVTHPDWGGRGNNPNKDVRIVRDARENVEACIRALKHAEQLNASI